MFGTGCLARDVCLKTFGTRYFIQNIRVETFGTRYLTRDVKLEMFVTRYLKYLNLWYSTNEQTFSIWILTYSIYTKQSFSINGQSQTEEI